MYCNPKKLKILYSAGYKLHIKFKDNKMYKIINNNKSNNYQHKNLEDLKIEGGDFIVGLYNQIKIYHFIVMIYDVLSLIHDKLIKF